MERFMNAGEIIEAISPQSLRKHSEDKEYLLQLESDIKLFITRKATKKEIDEIRSRFGGCEMLAMLCDGYRRLDKEKKSQ